VVADFNDDGFADLAVADAAEGTLAIRLGDGTRRYAPSATLQIDAGRTILGAGDFNGDGFADLAVVNWQTRFVTLWMNDRAGSFQPVAAVGIPSGVDAVAVRDLDGDGLADLVMEGGVSNLALALRSEWLGTPEASIRFALSEAPAGSASVEPVIRSEPDAALAGPTVASLSLSPPTIQGGSGGTSTATVTLSAPSPAGGTNLTLSSSITDLAASQPDLSIPAGASSGSFIVGTNPKFRRYSGLAFTVTITASANGSSKSAILSVTAQPKPADINGDSTQRHGTVCGSVFPARNGEGGILYQCFDGPDFGTVALNGSAQTKTDSTAIDVKDFRGSGAGWNLQITSTQFSAGAGKTLATDATTITLTSAACDTPLAGCTPAVNTILTPVTVPAAATAPTAVKFFSTPALTGMGDFTVTPNFSLAVPADVFAGTYNSTMTITIGNAP